MKKVFLALLFVGVTQLSMGQTQNDAFKKDVMKLVEATGSTSAMKVAKDQIIKMIPQEKQADFTKEFDAMLPSLYDKIAVIYMETYTEKDIKAMLKFYGTPVGKKMSEKAGEITQKSMAVAQEWVTGNMQDVIMKYMK